MLIDDIKPYERSASARRNDQSMTRAKGTVNNLYSVYLSTVSKDSGVKTGNLSNWSKIQSKLSKNGVKFMTREEFGKISTAEAKRIFKGQSAAKLIP